jgi:hypothetical protein
MLHGRWFLAGLLAVSACAAPVEDETSIRFEDGGMHETLNGAFSVEAWAGEDTDDECWFRVGMPTPNGKNIRGIPGAELDLHVGEDLGGAVPLDVTFTYEGDGTYRGTNCRLESGSTMFLEVTTKRVADLIRYSVA